jgi:hypothetical protein
MLKFKSLPILAGGALLGIAAFHSSLARADADPQIFIQQSGTSPANGTAIGGHSNLITDTSAFVLGVAGGNFIGNNPLLVIVGDFDGVGTPVITSSACGGSATSPCSAPTSNLYGFTSTTATYTSSSSGDAYDQLGTAKTGGSVTFANWTTIDQLNGFGTPTSFTLDVFAVPLSLDNTGDAGQNSPITLDLEGAAPGSFIIAYNCTTSGSATCSGNNEAEAVNTNQGLVAPAPPIGQGLPVVLAVGGLLLGFKLWERSQKHRSLGTVIPHAAA